MNERTHVDLFSGLGGFALAARANGIRTVQFCEYDARCREFLARAWPGVPCHPDVFEFDGHAFSDTYLLTAGVPCQPASRAGKQRGCKDDRWLWPSAVRVLSEVRPTWALFENPPGIGDVGLAGILADVEGQGYEVRVFSIPACAIGAPHRRERYWIVAHASEPGREGTDAEPGTHGLRAEHRQGDVADAGRIGSGQDEPGRGPEGRSADRRDRSGDMANPARGGLGADGGAPRDTGHADQRDAGDVGVSIGDGRQEGNATTATAGHRDTIESAGPWSRYVWTPCADGKFRRAPDDSQRMAHGLPVELLEGLGAEGRQTPEDCTPHRSVLAALGNSIVWQVAERVIAAMVEADMEDKF